MSQNFAGIPVKAYIGQFVGFNANLGRFERMLKNAQIAALLGRQLSTAERQAVARFAPIEINWTSYGAATAMPNLGVSIDLQASQTGGLVIDEIQSVYIDNTNSNVPIYVVFDDTGMVITAQPFSVGWHPAMTALKRATIYGRGFTDGFIPQTKIFFTNIDAIPYTDLEVDQSIALWRSSAAIQRSGNQILQGNFAPPALGDQTFQAVLNGLVSGNVNILGSPLAAGGFYYLTDVYLNLLAISAGGAGNFIVGDCFIESTGASGILYKFRYGTSTPAFGTYQIYSGKGNIKISAAETWRFRCLFGGQNNMSVADLNLVLNFTTNPQ